MSAAECPNRSTLFDYLVGKLPDATSDALAEHVEACPGCQAELATLSDIEDTLIGQIRVAASPDPFLDESECGRAVANGKGVGSLLCEASGGGKGDSPHLPERPEGCFAQMGTVPFSAAPEASESSLSIQLGEYQLIERLGTGGMGTVYKALHSKLDRVVALKILPPSRTEDQRAVLRFEREMKAIGRLDHPHIVRAYDAREIEGRLVLVMEFVEGLDLGKIVRRLGKGKGVGSLLCEASGGPFHEKTPDPFSDACEIARQAAIGLQAAHEHGMVHRDVKPSNLMLTPDGQVKLLDLGLARLQGKGVGSLLCEAPGGSFRKKTPDPFTDEDMTGTGQAMGTADYMAPEQASDSRAVDIRADVYSLGATLYKLLSGRAPFSGPEYESAFEKMLAHRQAPVPPIAQFCPDIPEGLVAVLDRMLAKDPAARYQTPAETAEALSAFCPGADLPALLQRAEAAPSSPLSPGEGRSAGVSPAESGQPGSAAVPAALGGQDARAPLAPRRRRTIVAALIALLLVGGLGFGLGMIVRGIMLRIHKDGKVTNVEIAEGADARVNADGSIDVTPAGGTISGESSRNTDLQQEIAKAVAALATQKALLQGLEKEMPAPERDALVEADPAARDLASQLSKNRSQIAQLKEHDAAQAKANSIVLLLELKAKELQSQYDARVAAIAAEARQRKRSAIEAEIATLEARLASLRQQGRPDAAAARPIPPDAKAVLQSLEASMEALEVAREKKAPDLGEISTLMVLRLDGAQSVFAGTPAEYRWKPVAQSLRAWQNAVVEHRDTGEQFEQLKLLMAHDFVKFQEFIARNGGVDAAKGPSSATPPEKPAETPLQFGPVIEQVVNALPPPNVVKGHGHDAINLAAGKLVDLPKDFEKWPFDKQGRWCADNSVDLLVTRNGTGELAPTGLKFAAIDGRQWEKATEKQLRSAFVSIEPGCYIIDDDGGTGQSAEVRERGGALFFGLTDSVPSGVFAFQTRKGVLGLLQVLRYTEEPPGMRIRYKCVQPPALSAVPVSPAADLKALQGQWRVVRAEKGRDADDDWGPIFGLTLVLDPTTTDRIEFHKVEDKWLLRVRQLVKVKNAGLVPLVPGGWLSDVEYRIDPTASPKTIDLGGERGNPPAALGIYSLDGDRLTLCLSRYVPALQANQRPGSFAAEPNSNQVRLVLERYRPTAEEKAAQEAAKTVEGWWAPTEQVDNGRPVPAKQLRNTCYSFGDDTITVHATDSNGMLNGQWHFKGYVLDASAVPKRITLIHGKVTPETPAGTKVRYTASPGIYKLDGDRLTIAYREGDKPPATFESKPGSGVTLLVFRKTTEPKQAFTMGGTVSMGSMGGGMNGTVPMGATASGSLTAPVNPAAEFKALQGHWKVVRVEKGSDADSGWAKILGYGEGAEDAAAASRFRFDEGTLNVLSFPKAETWQFVYSIDPTTAHKTINLSLDESDPTRPPRAVGIYEIAGDQLRICLTRYFPALKTDQRPKRLAIDSNSADILFTLQRYRPSADEKASETEWFQWDLVTQVEDGKPVAEERLRLRHCYLNAYNFAITEAVPRTPQTRGIISGLCRLDAEKQPKRMTIFALQVDDKPGRQDFEGIYKWEGDRLTIAYRKADRPPEAFESTPGSGVTLLVLKKANPAQMPLPAVGGAGGVNVGPSPAVNPAADAWALVGPWRVVKLDKGTKTDEVWGPALRPDPRPSWRGMPPPDPSTNSFPFFDRLTFSQQGDLWFASQETSKRTTVAIDPTTTPKTMNLFRWRPNPNDKPKEPLMLGIYEINGDRLKIHWVQRLAWLQSNQYPKDFSVVADSADLSLTLERPSKDERDMQAPWSVTSWIEDGKALPNAKLVFGTSEGIAPAACSIRRKREGKNEELVRGLCTLDRTKQPKWITISDVIAYQIFPTPPGPAAGASTPPPMMPPAGPTEKPPTKPNLVGIYKCEGNHLHIAYRQGGPRPEKFESPAGSGVTLLVLEKIKDEDEPFRAKSDASESPDTPR